MSDQTYDPHQQADPNALQPDAQPMQTELDPHQMQQALAEAHQAQPGDGIPEAQPMAAAEQYAEPATYGEPHEAPQAAHPTMEYDAAPAQQGFGDGPVESGAMEHIRPMPRVSIQAFCESDGVARAIDAAGHDRRMAKAHLKVQMGGVRAAADFYESATTPNLILVESSKDGHALIADLEALASVCDEGTNVVVIGHRNDVSLYRELISRGVAEYLVAPISMADVMEIVSTLFVSPDAEPLGHSIAFIGAKGGVGSSTIAHNVAWTIASSFASDVVLADFDLAFGTANINLDQDPAQGVAEAVFSSDRIDDTFLDRLLVKCSDHLSLLAAPSTLDREYDFGPDDFAALLEVAQRGTPNVIIDLPHMWTGWVRQTLASVDKVVITATPDLACLRNTKNLVDTLAELRPSDDKPFLVLNQMGVAKRPEIDIEDFTQPLDMDPTITVPFDPALFGLASNNGQMISETDAKHDIATSIETLAQTVTGRRDVTAAKKGGLDLGGLLAKLTKKKAA